MTRVRVGVAGWSLRREQAGLFGAGESQLARYATRLDCVEVNSCFYRPHRAATWARWAGAVPDGFRFAVKMPRTVTHEARLQDCAPAVAGFLEQVGALGNRLGPVLVQLPPSLRFEAEVAARFFEGLRGMRAEDVVCEPRHASWFEPGADALLVEWQVARVAADPARVPAAAVPGGWTGVRYHRLHGSPQTYYSGYGAERLDGMAGGLGGAGPAWVIFDNTALGEAVPDALGLRERLGGG